MDKIYLTVGVVTAAILVLTFVAIVVGLVWLRYFAELPCRTVKKVERTPDNIVITTMTDGTVYLGYGE